MKKTKYSKKELEVIQERWYKENLFSGRSFGYPECCIKAFGKQPPELLKQRKARLIDKLRYNSGCIDGKFTGFIPCCKCSSRIYLGKIKLKDLIQDRRTDIPPFPINLSY